MPNPRVSLIRRSVELIFRAVSGWLTARQRKAARAARFRRALASVGRFGSGRTDISVEHDRELAEIYGS